MTRSTTRKNFHSRSYIPANQVSLMDIGPSQSRHVEFLPAEILNLILSKCGGAGIAALYRAGSKLINSKLTSSTGIQIFDIWLPNTPVLNIWPNLICQLQGLRHLRLELQKDNGSMPYLNHSHLIHLPSELVEISFKFKEAEECWMRMVPRNSKTSWKEWPPCFKASEFFWDEQFPNLTTLRLVAPNPISNSVKKQIHGQGPANFDPIYGVLTEDFVRHLPPNLTTLELPNNSSITHDCAPYLPKSLLKLDINWNRTIDGKFLLDLPPNLTHLDISNCIQVLDSSLEKLPNTLTRLDMGDVEKVRGDFMSKLPTFLLHLDLEHCNLSKVVFPSALTYLKLSDTALSTKQVAELPRTLLWLDIWGSVDIGQEGIQNLPPLLETFKIGAIEELDGTMFPYLPKSLTYLNVAMMRVVKNKHFSGLPEKIVWLNVSSTSYLTIDVAKYVPKSLISLNISSSPVDKNKLMTRCPHLQVVR